MANDPEIIDIPDDDASEDIAVKSTESNQKPVLVVERNGASPQIDINRRNRRWLWIAAAAICMLALCVYFIYSRWEAANGRNDTVSEQEIIDALEQPYSAFSTGIESVRDTILGVTLEIYPLEGLRASLETEMPDTTDRSLVAFFRSADYSPDSLAIEPVVLNGNLLRHKDQDSRQAYVAISPQGKLAVGAGEGKKVKDYVIDNKGSFFRQYLLLSNNTLPPDFSLHGKVERAALGIMYDGKLYYVMTRGRETMWGFADALRENGFKDAIYITGGDKYDFRRSPDGSVTMGDKLREEYVEQRGRRLASPMLVFRSAN